MAGVSGLSPSKQTYVTEDAPPHLSGQRTSSLGRIRSRMSLRFATQDQELRAPPPEQSQLHLNRTMLGVEHFLTRIKRNAYTGGIVIMDACPSRDFHFVDLFHREFNHGKPELLRQDPYYFRPVPLQMRTWLYQSYWEENDLAGGTMWSAKDRFEHCIQAKVNDMSPIGGMGRWSPVLCLGPACFIVCMTLDLALVAMVVGSFLASVFVTSRMNRASLYRFERFLTIPFRWPIAIFVALAIMNPDRSGSTTTVLINLVAHGATIALLLTDVFVGDLLMLLGRPLECSYEIVKQLPGRVYVVRRVGGVMPGMGNPPGQRISELITGIDPKSAVSLTLLCDAQGLIVELFPMDAQDWDFAIWWYRHKKKAVQYYMTGTYNHNCRNAGYLTFQGTTSVRPSEWGRPVPIQRASVEAVHSMDFSSGLGNGD
mmetsp:Transcript_32685/g.84742  ORF Transcript_32685/g.84742 Transcript_32685/m.84742 type:complete len:427 (-) Transcript_32685:137-1417(-)